MGLLETFRNILSRTMCHHFLSKNPHAAFQFGLDRVHQFWNSEKLLL